MRIGIVYGTGYGNTAEAAKDIARELGLLLGQPIPTQDVCRVQATELAEYDVLLLGCSTWNVGEMQDDWDRRCDDLWRVDLTGRRFAVFGAGDAAMYDDTFADALGMLAEKIEARGARLFGTWPTDGYDFKESRAVRDGRFVGLPLDFDNQWELNAQRIEAWCALLARELMEPGRLLVPGVWEERTASRSQE